ncbi:MAG: sulfatase-like hydrolase/transferase, partial [Bryobacterales bacterium]|nr:sulfatase-like hydrolase/transferase [Bryobacterales bacterium]
TLSFLGRNREHPFFLYLPYTLPHADSERSRDTGDGYVVKNYGAYAQRDWDSADRGYAACVSRLDADVGRILEELRTLGLDERTLVLFASDNGPANEGRHKATFFQSSGKIRGVPLRGNKGDLYEGGIRVPAIARWPGVIAAGSTSSSPWAFMDLMPTFADLAGAPIPNGLDGVSIAPLLRGGNLPPDRVLYWEMPTAHSQQAVRAGQWKAVRVGKGTAPQLYHLASDPGEQHDLAQSETDRLRELTQAMDRAHAESPDYQLR